MSPILVSYLWRIGLLAVPLIAIVLGYKSWRGTVEENAQLRIAAEANTAAIRTLTERARAVEAAVLANSEFAEKTRQQATRGVARIQQQRKDNPDVQAIDKPWPAALRGRVFDNPDPASGSTEPAVDPAAGKGR